MSFQTNPRSVSGSQRSHSANSPTKAPANASSRGEIKSSFSTVLPKDVEGTYPHFTLANDEFMPAGNSKFNFMMRNAGFYGHHIARSKRANKLTCVTLHRDAFRTSVLAVLTQVIEHHVRKQGKTQPSEISALVTSTATSLTDGVMVMLYMRLRSLHECNPLTLSLFLKRPRVPEDFQVPKPFALALQYLGIFRVQDLTEELHLIPTVSEADSKNYCLSTNIWSLPAYQAAVDRAKDLGIRFASVDLTVKLGTAWWLFRSMDDDGDFQLECCLPETNYTDEDAVLRALWCHTSTGALHHDIADLSAYPRDRGTFLRNPPQDVATTCFLGMMDEPEEIWSVV